MVPHVPAIPPMVQEEVNAWMKCNTLPDLRAGFVINETTGRLVFVSLPEGHTVGVPLTPEQRAFLQGGIALSNPNPKEPPK